MAKNILKKTVTGNAQMEVLVILLGVGLVCLAICFWGIMLLLGNSHGNRVFITVDGNEFGMYNLNENKRIEVSEHNIVVIEGGKVYMEWADCPDKLCINQGKIAKTGQTIICLPNKVMVTIKGEAGEYDAIVR